MLYSSGSDWHISLIPRGEGFGGAAAAALAAASGTRTGRPTLPSGSGGASPFGEPISHKLNLDAVEVRVDPRAEWKEIFEEAWRINRDFFYDPSMHGADWPAMKAKYEVFLPHVNNSGDLYRVIGWMLSELAVGHSRYMPGERVNEKKTVGGGLLGANYEI